MMIEDRYFVPNGLFEAVRASAERENRVQYLGITHRSSDQEPGILKYQAMLQDLRDGKNCSWHFGPSRDEMQAEFGASLAVICWITGRE
jgi:hypothetical protein